MAPQILLVEDDPVYLAGLTTLFERAGHDVRTAGSGTEALAILQAWRPHVIVMDFALPGLTAIELLDSIYRMLPRIHVETVILTGAALTEADELSCFHHGASDFIRKGSPTPILLARVDSALRRVSRTSRRTFGRLTVDLGEHKAWEGDRTLTLQAKPMRLLNELIIAGGRTVSRDTLLKTVWNTEYRGFDHAVEQAVHTLRRALSDRQCIQTVYGLGWRLLDTDDGQ